jgi:hypothetical protein
MSDEMLNIKPSDVAFLRKLNRSEYSDIFHVRVRSKECVMKVVSDVQDRYLTRDDTL